VLDPKALQTNSLAISIGLKHLVKENTPMRQQVIQASMYAFFNHPKGMIVPEIGLLMQNRDDDLPNISTLQVKMTDNKLLKYTDQSYIINFDKYQIAAPRVITYYTDSN
jgi:hypothetical protein